MRREGHRVVCQLPPVGLSRASGGKTGTAHFPVSPCTRGAGWPWPTLLLAVPSEVYRSRAVFSFVW